MSDTHRFLTDGKRVIVCGGRNYDNAELVSWVLNEQLGQAERGSNVWPVLIHGGASGADSLADEWAAGKDVGVDVFRPDWAVHGRAAGPIRNEEMAQAGADLVIAFPGGRGTADMVRRARAHGIEVLIVTEHPRYGSGYQPIPDAETVHHGPR